MKILYFEKEQINFISIPYSMSGTYFLLDNDNEVVYVGKALNVLNRLHQHKKEKQFDKVIVIEMKNSENAKMLESVYLNCNLPLLNKVCPTYNDIPLWVLRDEIKDIEYTIKESFIDLKNELRADYEKFIRLELKQIMYND
jgi:hypothetical protein